VYELILIPAAAVMVYIIAALIRWASNVRERTGYSLVLFIFSMMAGMLGGIAIYFYRPDLASLEAAAVMNFVLMPAGIMAILFAFLTKGKERRQKLPQAGFPGHIIGRIAASYHGIFVWSVIALALLNEVLMGLSFSIISGSIATRTAAFATPAGALVSETLNSYWFTLTMGAEMLLTTYYFRNRIRHEFRNILLVQGAIMLLSPPALLSLGLTPFSIYAGSLLMILLIIYFFDYFYKNRSMNRPVSNYIILLLLLYSFMMASLFYWRAGGSDLLFGLSLVFEMLIFFEAVIDHRKFSVADRRNWTDEPWWTLLLLALVFISEYFMGALLDIQFYGISFLDSVGTVALRGSPPAVVGGAVYNFIQYFSLVTNSSWFYIMMGAEMGTLVVMQIRKVRQLETKVRLMLIIVAYALYTVFFPYFFLSHSDLPRTAFLGWNMGLGTTGPLAPAFLIAVGLTYLISGILAFLFGGRQVCSMFCSAALMYQGTFYDSSKAFNRKSSLSRKLQSNRLSKTYIVVASLVWATMLSSAALSYLDAIRVTKITVFGEDPLMFAYSFYLNFLWYIIFITIPFVGTYGCVNTGFCSWGMFNQFVGRIGFWRLKVHDPYECVKCKTKDCAKVCPVGLTTMPGSFIEKGEFRHHKCIGVGDCASACPVDNIFFYDVRHWFRDRATGKRMKERPFIPIVTTGKSVDGGSAGNSDFTAELK
jgi:polyferredoxin